MKTTVMIWRLVQDVPCLSPKDSWCGSVEAAGPEGHLQWRKFLEFAGGKLKRLLKWGHA